MPDQTTETMNAKEEPKAEEPKKEEESKEPTEMEKVEQEIQILDLQTAVFKRRAVARLINLGFMVMNSLPFPKNEKRKNAPIPLTKIEKSEIDKASIMVERLFKAAVSIDSIGKSAMPPGMGAGMMGGMGMRPPFGAPRK